MRMFIRSLTIPSMPLTGDLGGMHARGCAGARSGSFNARCKSVTIRRLRPQLIQVKIRWASLRNTFSVVVQAHRTCGIGSLTNVVGVWNNAHDNKKVIRQPVLVKMGN